MELEVELLVLIVLPELLLNGSSVYCTAVLVEIALLVLLAVAVLLSVVV
jgi:hypothetical protein